MLESILYEIIPTANAARRPTTPRDREAHRRNTINTLAAKALAATTPLI
jgi:hypothetical protein